MDANCSFITQMFEKKMNSLLKRTKERQPSKKRTNPSISKFFFVKDTFNKEDVSQKEYLEDLGLLIVKKNLPI